MKFKQIFLQRLKLKNIIFIEKKYLNHNYIPYIEFFLILIKIILDSDK